MCRNADTIATLASDEKEKPAGPKKKRNEASLKEDTNMDDRTRQTALHETELTNYFARDFTVAELLKLHCEVQTNVLTWLAGI